MTKLRPREVKLYLGTWGFLFPDLPLGGSVWVLDPMVEISAPLCLSRTVETDFSSHHFVGRGVVHAVLGTERPLRGSHGPFRPLLGNFPLPLTESLAPQLFPCLFRGAVPGLGDTVVWRPADQLDRLRLGRGQVLSRVFQPGTLPLVAPHSLPLPSLRDGEGHSSPSVEIF